LCLIRVKVKLKHIILRSRKHEAKQITVTGTGINLR
jgi:hypothetical protein